MLPLIMYPILAAGASSAASSLLQGLGSALTKKLSGPANSDSTGGAAPTGATRQGPTAAEQVAKLRSQLLDTPELQTALNAADPTRGASIGISQGGIVTYTTQDGHASALNLSPRTAELARQLGGLMGQQNQTTGGIMPLTGLGSVRSLNAFA